MRHDNRWNTRDKKPRRIRKRGLRISLSSEGNGLRYEGVARQDEAKRPVSVVTTLKVTWLPPKRKKVLDVAPSPDLPGDFFCRNGSAPNWRPRMTL